MDDSDFQISSQEPPMSSKYPDNEPPILDTPKYHTQL